MDNQMIDEVQSLILNISFPQELDELYEIVKENGLMDVEVLETDPENYTWTVSKWVKPGDVIFFMHSKNSIHRIRRLKKELNNECVYDSQTNEYRILKDALDRAESLYSKYGGKIFLVAKSDSKPCSLAPEENEYTPFWKSRIYSEIRDSYLLENPIELAEFKSFLTLSSGGSITPVYGKEFEKLKKLILEKNNGPKFLDKCVSMPIPFMMMDETNWLEISSKYRMSFIYEKQFRAFYVDYFLRIFGDRKKFYSECACEKKGQNISYIDNVIVFNKKYLPVEIKLSVESEDNIEHQLRKYCYLDMLYLDRERKQVADKYDIVSNKVLVIDTYSVYLYDYDKKTLDEVNSLAEIHDNTDIISLRESVLSKL